MTDIIRYSRTATSRHDFPIHLAILLIILGILAILVPFEMSFGAVIAVCWLLVISGIVQFLDAVFTTGVGPKAWKVAIAVFFVVTGVYIRVNLDLGIVALRLALIVFFVAQAVTDIIASLSIRNSGSSRWLLLDGVITLTLALMILPHWPSGSPWAVGMLVGINMITSGAIRLRLAIKAQRAAKVAAAEQ